MGRQRKPSAKALAASEVVAIVAKAPEPSPVKQPKARMKPPMIHSSPQPFVSVPEVRRDAPIQSEYEEVPSAASFQPLSAATINSSPCKSARARCSPLSARKGSPRASPSILRRKRSFDGRMQLLNANEKLPSLEAVAPPVIKPEMVEQAKFLQAARPLQRYSASSGEESDGDTVWESNPSKRARVDRSPGHQQAWSDHGSSSREVAVESYATKNLRRASLGSGSRQPPTEWQEDDGVPPRIDESDEGSHSKVSKVRDVLLAMAEIAQPVESKDVPKEKETTKPGSALSMLRCASSNQSRPSSTDALEGLSQDTISPTDEPANILEKTEAKRETTELQPEANGAAGKEKDLTDVNNMVSLLSSLAGAV